jgi:hypothetical protein
MLNGLLIIIGGAYIVYQLFKDRTPSPKEEKPQKDPLPEGRSMPPPHERKEAEGALPENRPVPQPNAPKPEKEKNDKEILPENKPEPPSHASKKDDEKSARPKIGAMPPPGTPEQEHADEGKSTSPESKPITPPRVPEPLDKGPRPGENKPKPAISLRPPHERDAGLPDDRFHMSLAKGYLDKFNLPATEEKSFFHLFNLLYQEGKKDFLEKVSAVLSKSTDANQLLSACRNLIEDASTLQIAENVELEMSPIISKNSINDYFLEYDLQEIATTDLRKAVLLLFERVYLAGKNKQAANFKNNFDWLAKYLSEKDEDKIAKEIGRIKLKVTDEAALIQKP